MMEVYKTPNKEIQEIILANVTYEPVIEGLNGYFESEPRNDYITIRGIFDGRVSLLYEAEAWADILISWLRKKHGIFYYPGMEAKYAKMEKIPPFTERAMDEGALNSLKALHKRVTGKETSTSSHTLIADNIKYFVNEEESDIKKLKERIAELESNFKAVCDESDLFKTRALKAEEEVRKLKVELNAIKDTVSQARSRLNSKFVSLPGYEGDLVKLADIALKAVEARDETINRINVTAQKEAKQDISDRIHEICTAKEVELDDAFLYNDDYTWEDLVGFLCEEIRKLKKEVEDAQKEAVCKDIMNYIRYEASQNGFELPEKIDGEPLTIKRVFHDLLELMRKRGEEIRNLNVEIKAKESGIEDLKEHITLLEADLKKRTAEIKDVRKKHWNDLRDIHKALGCDGTYDNTDDFAKAVKARAECFYRSVGGKTQKSDINALIRDYCTKNNIIAPSRYFSDKACVEYLFSVINLDRKDRAAAILYDLYHDIFHKDCNQFTYEDIATKILNRMLETEDLLHKSVDSVNKECKATGKMMVDDYKLKLKDYILKDIKEHGYRYNGLETKSVEEIVDWIITMATGPRNEWVDWRVENLRGQIKRLKDLINAMNEEVGDM